jgi:hypothetical protein
MMGGGRSGNMMTIGQLFGGFGGNLGSGGQQQQPSPFSQLRPPANYQQPKLPDWVQAPDPNMPSTNAFVKLTNPDTGETFMAPGGGYSVRNQQPQQQYDPTAAASDMMYRPQVEQQPAGFDQRAIAADPQGFQQYMQQMQQREQQRPGSTMLPQQQPASFDPRAIAGNPQGFQQYMQQMQQREQQRPGSTMLPQQQPQFNPYQQQRQQFNPYQRQNPYQQQRQQFNPYQQQMQQRQQFNPYQQQGRGLGDLMSMMGIRRSMPQPRMSMDMPQYSTDYGRNFGIEQRYFAPQFSPVTKRSFQPPSEFVAAPAVPYAPPEWANSWKDGGEV